MNFFFIATPRNDKLQEELTQRLTDRVGTINSNSSSDDVQRWLASKQISSQLARNLQGMTGEELFQVSKATLDQFTDETESARIYSLLSQQKKLAGVRLFFLLLFIRKFSISFSSINPQTRRINHLFSMVVHLVL